MRHLVALCLVTTVACGGEAPPPPAPAPAPKVEAPAPAPAPEPEVDFGSLSPEDQKAHLLKLGEEVYLTGKGGIPCNTCHGNEGKGTPGAFPPLVGQKDHMGDCQKHATIVIKGLTGELVVDGVTYNGVMTPQGDMLDDLKIAAVLTYERNSWGNDYGICMPADVAAARAAAP